VTDPAQSQIPRRILGGVATGVGAYAVWIAIIVWQTNAAWSAHAADPDPGGFARRTRPFAAGMVATMLVPVVAIALLQVVNAVSP